MKAFREDAEQSSPNRMAQDGRVSKRVKIASAAAAALLAMTNASGRALTLEEINNYGLEGYVATNGPGSFRNGAEFTDLTYFTPDGTKFTTNGRLTPDSTFLDGTTDNLLIDIVNENGDVVAYLSTGFLSNYYQDLDINPNLRVYTGRDGTRWGISEFDNNGTPYIDITNDTQTRFDLRPVHTTSVPEPSTGALSGLGLGAGVYMARRRKGAANEPKKTQAA